MVPCREPLQGVLSGSRLHIWHKGSTGKHFTSGTLWTFFSPRGVRQMCGCFNYLLLILSTCVDSTSQHRLKTITNHPTAFMLRAIAYTLTNGKLRARSQAYIMFSSGMVSDVSLNESTWIRTDEERRMVWIVYTKHAERVWPLWWYVGIRTERDES